MAEDWEVGPQFRNKPGSQGTLFGGGKKYLSDERYHRGYTPERLHEVANAVGGSYTQGKGANANYFRDHPHGHRVDGEFVVTGRANNKPKRDLVDNIARSTVPVTDITNAEPGRKTHFWVHESLDKHLEDQGAAGTYEHRPPAHSNRHDIRIQTGYSDSKTVIHEIGHHVSHMAGTHYSAYGTDAERGQEEAHADEYAQEHFRDRRGKRTQVDVYNGGKRDARRNDSFYQAYHGVRGTSDPGYRWSGLPSDPQNHVLGQQPLVHKIEDRHSDEAVLQHHLNGTPLKTTYRAEVNMEAHPNYKRPDFG